MVHIHKNPAESVRDYEADTGLARAPIANEVKIQQLLLALGVVAQRVLILTGVYFNHKGHKDHKGYLHNDIGLFVFFVGFVVNINLRETSQIGSWQQHVHEEFQW